MESLEIQSCQAERERKNSGHRGQEEKGLPNIKHGVFLGTANSSV